MEILRKLVAFGGKFLDYKIGALGALFMGFVVFCINFYHSSDFLLCLPAVVKQGVYTFFFGGIFMKGAENLAVRIKNKTLAILAAVIIPSTITLFLTYQVHLLKGTPKPLQSTLPTLLIIPATAVWAVKKRNASEKYPDFPSK